MQTKSIFTVALAIFGMATGWVATAGQDGTDDSGFFSLQNNVEEAAPEESSQATPVLPRDTTEIQVTDPDVPPPARAPEVLVRSSRPRNDPHRDARACLDAGNNVAIIRCAEKYR